MKTNVLPPVIEELLQKSNIVLQILEACDLGGSVTRNLRKAVVDTEQYKKQLERDDLISLFVVSEGEKQNGYPEQHIEIRMPRNIIDVGSKEANNFLRKETKQYFGDVCSLVMGFPLKSIKFEDETKQIN